MHRMAGGGGIYYAAYTRNCAESELFLLSGLGLPAEMLPKPTDCLARLNGAQLVLPRTSSGRYAVRPGFSTRITSLTATVLNFKIDCDGVLRSRASFRLLMMHVTLARCTASPISNIVDPGHSRLASPTS